jgi:AraC-like DNA-binding protein
MPNPLIEAVRRFTESQSGESPFVTVIEGLTIFRSDHEKPPNHVSFKPALCIVVQGAKWVMFGNRRFDYCAGQALVVSVEMPLLGRVAEASPSEPYLGIIIEFDLAIMREVLEGLSSPLQPTGELKPGLFVADLDEPLTDCSLRMVRLLGTPEAIPVLRPLILREICYWLLTGPHGREIANIALANTHSQSIIHAIHDLRERFAEPVRIEELAEIARMSCSVFHRRFKAITSMTPLQYQKHLRLLEARRLLVADATNVESAAFQVGYESPSQFNREYSRMFGAPPRRDIVGLRKLVT